MEDQLDILKQPVTKKDLMDFSALFMHEANYFRQQKLAESMAKIVGISQSAADNYINRRLKEIQDQVGGQVNQQEKGGKKQFNEKADKKTSGLTKKEIRLQGKVKPQHYLSRAIYTVAKSLANERGLSQGIPFLQISNAIRGGMTDQQKENFTKVYNKIIEEIYLKHPDLNLDQAYDKLFEYEKENGIKPEEMLPQRSIMQKIFDSTYTDPSLQQANQKLRADSPPGNGDYNQQKIILNSNQKQQQQKQQGQGNKKNKEFEQEEGLGNQRPEDEEEEEEEDDEEEEEEEEDEEEQQPAKPAQVRQTQGTQQSQVSFDKSKQNQGSDLKSKQSKQEQAMQKKKRAKHNE